MDKKTRKTIANFIFQHYIKPDIANDAPDETIDFLKGQAEQDADKLLMELEKAARVVEPAGSTSRQTPSGVCRRDKTEKGGKP